MRVVDLGCGTGEPTQQLHRKLNARSTLGLDSSPEMLRESSAFEGSGLSFERGDLEQFEDRGAYDLVFSNAALQWVPDHEAVLARLAASLRPRGQLAIQVPANQDHPSHVLAREVGRGFPVFPHHVPDVLAPERYAELRCRLGFSKVHVRLQVYMHQLERRDDVVEWVKGTLLTAWKRSLTPLDYEVFLRLYRHRLLESLTDESPYFYSFKRLLSWGRRDAG